MSSIEHCRLCALKSENVINVFQNLDLAAKIKLCLQILISPDDVLPKTVCFNCCEKVLEYNEFFNSCNKSQENLISLLSENDITGENEEAKEIDMIFPLSEYSEENKELDGASNCFETTDVALTLENATTEQLVSDGQLDKSAPCSLLAACDEPAKNFSLPDIFEQVDSDNEEDGGNKNSDFDDMSNETSVIEKTTWKCCSCGEEQASLTALRSHHLYSHNQQPIYQCSHCNKMYTRYRSYSRHTKIHLLPKRFSCSVCGRNFSQKSVLENHKSVHSDERPHYCACCGKSFKQFSSLYLHSKSHVPGCAKPQFSCTVCSKIFSSKSTLDTHMKIHTGEKNFICDICGKRFVAKGSLDYHILTHNEEKPHGCQICEKSFKTVRLLNKHTAVHTGVKPHQCDVCGKQFRERGALKEHNRIHTGAMPYSCDFCGKLFRFKGILTVHRRVHTGERPYVCKICQREFTNWANYNKHMKRRHKEEESQEVVETTEQVESTIFDEAEVFPQVSDNLTPLEVYRGPELGEPSLAHYYLPQQHIVKL